MSEHRSVDAMGLELVRENVLMRSRIIAFALAGGVVIFLLAALVLVTVGSMTPAFAPGPTPVLGMHPTLAMFSAVWLAIAVLAVPMGLLVRRLALARAFDQATGRVDPGTFVLGNLIAYAIFEGLGIFGVVICLLSGTPWPGAAMALVSVLLIAATLPSRRSLNLGSADAGGDRTPFNGPA